MNFKIRQKNLDFQISPMEKYLHMNTTSQWTKTKIRLKGKCKRCENFEFWGWKNYFPLHPWMEICTHYERSKACFLGLFKYSIHFSLCTLHLSPLSKIVFVLLVTTHVKFQVLCKYVLGKFLSFSSYPSFMVSAHAW